MRSRRRATTIESSSSGRQGSTRKGLELVEAPRGDRDAREAGGRRAREAGLEPRRRVPRRRRRRCGRRRVRRETPARCSPPGSCTSAGCSGVLRPAIAVVDSRALRPSVLIDAGANADARPEHLLQFAHMGSVFAEEILGVHRTPRSGCSRSARSAEKGNAAHARGARAAAASDLELRSATRRRATSCAATADVVVTDGFTGNVALKLLEGTISELLASLRDEIGASRTSKLGGLLIRPAARRLRSRLDPDTYGGAYLLGLRGLSVDRPRELVQPRDRERDPAGRPRRRAPGRRAAERASARPCSIARSQGPPTQVR